MIKKTNKNYDINKLIDCYDKLNIPWNNINQICLTSIPGSKDPLYDGSGSIVSENKEKKYKETDFTVINDLFKNTYFEEIINDIGVYGRIRLMKLKPHTCLSIHKDFDKRYHMAIITNLNSYIIEFKNGYGEFYHIPADGYIYSFDSTKLHTVMNTDNTEDRIHLVFNGL